jgi:uncharacterized membrane protein (DUF441 family)
MRVMAKLLVKVLGAASVIAYLLYHVVTVSEWQGSHGTLAALAALVFVGFAEIARFFYEWHRQGIWNGYTILTIVVLTIGYSGTLARSMASKCFRR